MALTLRRSVRDRLAYGLGSTVCRCCRDQWTGGRRDQAGDDDQSQHREERVQQTDVLTEHGQPGGPKRNAA